MAFSDLWISLREEPFTFQGYKASVNKCSQPFALDCIQGEGFKCFICFLILTKSFFSRDKFIEQETLVGTFSN